MNRNLNSDSNEITLAELITIFKHWWNYLKFKWILFVFFAFLGGISGYFYASMDKLKYNAKLTFIVEEGKSSSNNLGGLASLAGQFGVDVGGSGGGGVLSGENILVYLKSESLAREVLLSRIDSNTNNSIADFYSEVYNLKNSWTKNVNIGAVSFPVFTPKKVYSRLQDSLIKKITTAILASQFFVSKTDKKASFIEVNVTMQNEYLAKVYCEKIVEVAVSRYINIKTERQKKTVEKLEFRADSIANLLSRKTYSSASIQTINSTIDLNPLYRTGQAVTLETTTRDKSMLSAIFTSVVQNLEMAKFTLSQETPVIQIVDSPIFPLNKQVTSKSKTAIIFSLSFCSILLFLLVFVRIYQKNRV